MHFTRFFTLIALAAFSSVSLFNVASAAILKDEKGLRWASNRDLTSQQFGQRFSDYRADGMMIVDIDAYPTSSGTRYSMIWRENTDGRGWAEHRGLTSNGYNQRWQQYRDQGFRPHDIETWVESGNRKWAGIWVENKEDLRWTSNRGLTGEAYGEMFQERSDAGFRLLDMEAYQTGNGLRYAAIWIENKDNRRWAQLRNMPRQRYQQEVDARSANGFRVVDFEAYQTSSGLRYAAIWEQKPGYAWQTRTNRTAMQFANLWREYLDDGYRLIDFERHETPSGPRYGGVWAENAERFRRPNRRNIDTLVSNYRANNNLPGVSVAVIQDGELIYRGGDGNAEIDLGKEAWGGTVYGLASISKAVGGTLAAKFESEGRLQDGTTFDLDLNDPTSDYLTNVSVSGQTVSIPNQHTHTVEQLFSHLACVAHYPGNPPSPGVASNSGSVPGIANQTTHYTTALAAARSIWNTGLITDTEAATTAVTPCLVSGQTGGVRRYSTHAFTIGGAVLESATGRTISQLVDGELVDQYGLGTMRVMYSGSTLPNNFDRAAWYFLNNSNAITERNFFDNSWKVLGGGIESSAIDLARFGWKILNGDIVDARTRDCRMWAQVDPDSTNGVGWDLATSAAGRRIADHGGDATGMDTYVRVYRDDGLVIAILANMNVTTSRETLANSIEALLLTGPVSTPPANACIIGALRGRIVPPSQRLQPQLPKRPIDRRPRTRPKKD